MSEKPLIIAGPCAAESKELCESAAKLISGLAKELDFDVVFKASFDKANRTSLQSGRGQEMQKVLQWLSDIRATYNMPVLTDIHESHQAAPVGEVCDYLQIPAFLCRQTDLVVAAAQTGRHVNIKKGQFLAPDGMRHLSDKVRQSRPKDTNAEVYVTERGTSFGYGDLVVDPRAFSIMSKNGDKVIFDITHSTQKPASGSASSGGSRSMAPTLARAATATGYLSGYFLEIHADPAKAISDKEAQLNFDQAESLIRQLVPLWKSCRQLVEIDSSFH